MPYNLNGIKIISITRIKISYTSLTRSNSISKENQLICDICLKEPTVKHIFEKYNTYESQRRGIVEF